MRSVAAAIAGMGVMIALPAAAQDASLLERAARQATAETGARGLAIATIANGKVASVQTFGDRNEGKAPLTRDTVTYGASLTKAVVGYLTVQLAAECRLDLDGPIASMLPEPLPSYGNLRAFDKWGDLASDERWRAITPHMVLKSLDWFCKFRMSRTRPAAQNPFRSGHALRALG